MNAQNGKGMGMIMKKVKAELVTTGMKDKKRKKGCFFIPAVLILLAAVAYALFKKNCECGEEV